MKIQKQTSSQLILSGIPGSLVWMLVLTFLGLLLMTISLLMGVKVWNDSAAYYLMMPLVICSFFGAGFIWIGISQLKERERLILDKIKRSGNYMSTTPYLLNEVLLSFTWNQIESIELTPIIPTQKSNSSKDTEPIEPSQIQIVLNLKDPMHQIVLETAQNDDKDRLAQIAQEVSGFLEIQLKNSVT